MPAPPAASSEMMFFSLLARCGSLSAAARELQVSTPAVSKRLAQLEARLGAPLLHRTTRRISLTPEGETYDSTYPDRFDATTPLLAAAMRSGCAFQPSIICASRFSKPSSATATLMRLSRRRRVAFNPDFSFTVKLYRGFTHEPELPPGALGLREDAVRASPRHLDQGLDAADGRHVLVGEQGAHPGGRVAAGLEDLFVVEGLAGHARRRSPVAGR